MRTAEHIKIHLIFDKSGECVCPGKLCSDQHPVLPNADAKFVAQVCIDGVPVAVEFCDIWDEIFASHCRVSSPEAPAFENDHGVKEYGQVTSPVQECPSSFRIDVVVRSRKAYTIPGAGQQFHFMVDSLRDTCLAVLLIEILVDESFLRIFGAVAETRKGERVMWCVDREIETGT